MDKYEQMYKSFYCNLRNSIAPDSPEHKEEIKNDYENKESIDYMRELITKSESKIVILGSQCCVDIITDKIFPELKGKLKYKDEKLSIVVD